MIRSEIRENFRTLNPEINDRVITDAALNAMLIVGDKEVCARTRCILSDYSFTCASNDQYWDLTSKISTFMAIDDFPGGGVCYDNSPLDMTTIAQLDQESPTWRNRSAGTPDYYFMRGKMLWVDRPILTAATVKIYYAAVSDDFNSDDIMPYNQLSYLEPYHNALVLYLNYRAAIRQNKTQEAAMAKSEYEDYIAWMKKEIISSKKGVVHFKPKY